jgi:PKD repeat protein
MNKKLQASMNRNALLLFALILISAVSTAQNSNPVFPANNQVLSDSVVVFSWNPMPGSNITYQVQVASDSLFLNLIADQANLGLNSLQLTIGMGQTYWWRTRHFISGNPAGWSSGYKLITFKPSLIPRITGWLKADTGLTLSASQIQTWQSFYGSVSLTQTDPARMPVSTDTALFGKRSVYFDGTDDYLQSAFLNYPTGTFILFHNPLNKNSTLFSQARFTFTGYNFYLNNSQRPSVNCLQTPSNAGFTFNGYAIPYTIPSKKVSMEGIVLKPSGATMYTGLTDTTSSQTIAYMDVPASTYFRIGAMGNNSGYYKGHVYEVFISDTSLSKTQYESLYNYISWKYQPPVNLGPDIHRTYGFCPHVLQPSCNYASYLWSNGDTLKTLTVKNPGTYWLQVTDFLGRTSRDTILITSSVPTLFIPDTIICLNTLASLQSGFSGAYQYTWDNDPLLNQLVLSTSAAGSHILVVKDSFNCSISDTAVVTIDYYANGVSLGPNKSVCTGAVLTLLTGALQTITYHWSTGVNDTLPQITVNTTGNYSVTTTNNRGCIANSQVNVYIKGASPSVSFQKSTGQICMGDTLMLTDLSTPASPSFPVTRWLWDFGNGQTDTIQHPKVSYQQSGLYYITLTASTDSGCSAQYLDSVVVYSLPVIWITTGNRCSARPVAFTCNSSSGNISQYYWQFDNGSSSPDTSTLADPIYTWVVAGIHQVSLQATSIHGCKKTETTQFEVYQSPSAQFNYTPTLVCADNKVDFNDISIADPSYPNNYWKWTFGDGTPAVTGLLKPSHSFQQTGNFGVQLLTGSLITGCLDSLTHIITVGEKPDAIILDTSFCIGQPKGLTQNSVVISDTIISWIWSSAAFGTLTGSGPVVVLNDTGKYQVQLVVTTQRGCMDTARAILVSYAAPKALFTMSPMYGNPPLAVQFQNKTASADTYHWDFGDGMTSGLENPSHTYTQKGIWEVSLLASTLKGCFDTYTGKVYTIKPNFDLEVTGAQAIVADGRIKTTADVRNNASMAVHRIDLECWINGENPVVETWQAMTDEDRLQPGHTLRYYFVSQPLLPDETSVSKYSICIRAAAPEYPVDDNPDNDRRCVALTDSFIISNPYPNPASHALYLDAILEFTDQVTIAMQNLQGQQIAILFDDTVDKGFSRLYLQVPPDCSHGVYILQIKYRDYIGTKKLIITD